MGVGHPQAVVDDVDTDGRERLPSDRCVGLRLAEVLAAITLDQPPRDARLAVDERPVPGQEAAPGDERAASDVDQLVGSAVVQVMEDPHRDYEVERLLRGEVGVEYVRSAERTPFAVARPRGTNVLIAEIEPGVVDQREVIEDVASAAPDIQDAVPRRGPHEPRDEQLAGPNGAEAALRECVQLRDGEQSAGVERGDRVSLSVATASAGAGWRYP